ncbi:hypothetical protein TH53_12215 [Pedobacter lusitanus]|uniref:Uncharacterized protein n=1 Tax=Pedobacter lusitanus TaxID=1503925 RepID=A0A0D0GI09_9SPHI|nr:hypothetical protein TH53_12215 [Pedobacter lusitanus]
MICKLCFWVLQKHNLPSQFGFCCRGLHTTFKEFIKFHYLVQRVKSALEVKNGKKHERGVTPPSNQAHTAHEKSKREGSSGTPNNGQVLCRGCKLDKH